MSNEAVLDAYKTIEERKAYLPDQYQRFGPFVGTAAQSIQPELSFDLGQFNTAPIMGIWADKKIVPLSKPILVKVYRDGDNFFAENDTLVLSGMGASREGAMLDFFEHLDYFYNFYKNAKERELVGDALRLKKIYETLF